MPHWAASMVSVDCFLQFRKCGIQTGFSTKMLKYCLNPSHPPLVRVHMLSHEALAHFVEPGNSYKCPWLFLAVLWTLQPQRNNTSALILASNCNIPLKIPNAPGTTNLPSGQSLQMLRLFFFLKVYYISNRDWCVSRQCTPTPTLTTWTVNTALVHVHKEEERDYDNQLMRLISI